MKKQIVIILIIAFSTASFLAGMFYQKSQTPSFRSRTERGFQSGREGMQSGANMVRGEVISIDKNNFVVKLPDESSKIVVLTNNTVINESKKVSSNNLTKGKQVVVFGQTNQDGSVTAESVQLNPQSAIRRP